MQTRFEKHWQLLNSCFGGTRISVLCEKSDASKIKISQRLRLGIDTNCKRMARGRGMVVRRLGGPTVWRFGDPAGHVNVAPFFCLVEWGLHWREAAAASVLGTSKGPTK